MNDAGIVRNRLKIEGAVKNAEGVSGGSAGVRKFRRVHLAVCRWGREAETAQDDERHCGDDGGIGCDEQGPEEAGINIRRLNDLLCVHAGGGDGG